jgi:DNA-binding CsgD family transcriptional regulator
MTERPGGEGEAVAVGPPRLPTDRDHWAELVAAASVLHAQVLARLEFPALILDLPSGVILCANEALAEAFGIPMRDLVGRVNTEVVTFDDAEGVRRALDALYAGAVDGYRAHRWITTPAGVRKSFYLWCRAIDIDGARHGVFILSETADGGTRARTDPLPVLALEPLVVGTVDHQWRLERASSEICALLGCPSERRIGRNLLADVHPDDVGGLVRAANSPGGADVVMRHLRLRRADGSWVAVRCLLVPLADGGGTRFAFALLLAEPTTAPGPTTNRVVELEGRLRRIAAELRAAGVVDDLDRLPTSTDYPQLNDLTSRQWDILIRLLRGDRVSTIAAGLFLSQSTVRNYLTAIFSRFGVHSQSELIALLRPHHA